MPPFSLQKENLDDNSPLENNSINNLNSIPKDVPIYSVKDINFIVREKIREDKAFNNIWLKGEIFNLNYHSSGHVYFSLKDAESSIRCSFFKRQNQAYQEIKLQMGQEIIVMGSLNVYIPRGEYQFNVVHVSQLDKGSLRIQIEALKLKLHKEGLFDQARKKSLPYYVQNLGIVSSPTSAAIQDMLTVVKARNSICKYFIGTLPSSR